MTYEDMSPVPWPGFTILSRHIDVGDVAFLVDLSLTPGHDRQIVLGHVDRGALDLIHLLALLAGAKNIFE